MISRRALISRLAVLGAGGAGLWLVHDRLPWPPIRPRFANGRDTPWQKLAAGGGLIEIGVSVNGHPVSAIVDSGAQFSAIDRTLAERLDLPRTWAAPILAYGVSGKPSLSHTVRLSLAAPGLVIDGLRAAVLDLASLSEVTGRDFRLLIGRDVLRQLVVEADFPLGRARFLAAGRYMPPPDAVTVPLGWRGGGPTTPVRVEHGAEPVEVLVDTGASGLLALSEDAARSAGLLGPERASTHAHSVGVGGLSLNRVVRAHSVQLASLTLRGVDVQVYQPAANAPAPSGLLGTGLFRQFRMALDLGSDRLFLVRSAPLIISSPLEPSP